MLKYWIEQAHKAFDVIAIDNQQKIVVIKVGDDKGNAMMQQIPFDIENLLIIFEEIPKNA